MADGTQGAVDNSEVASLRRQLESANKRASDWAFKLGSVEAERDFLKDVNQRLLAKNQNADKVIADLERQIRRLEGDCPDDVNWLEESRDDR